MGIERRLLATVCGGYVSPAARGPGVNTGVTGGTGDVKNKVPSPGFQPSLINSPDILSYVGALIP